MAPACCLHVLRLHDITQLLLTHWTYAGSANVVQAASGPLAGPGPAMSAIVMPAPMPADGGMSQAPLAGPSPAASPAVLTAPVQADGRRCWSASQICQQVPSLSSFGAALQARTCAS